MDDQEKRILTIEFQLGIKQDIRPRNGMRFRRKSNNDNGDWTTILGTWRYESSKPPWTQGPIWWVVQKVIRSIERDPHLISEKSLANILQNIQTEIEGKEQTNDNILI